MSQEVTNAVGAAGNLLGAAKQIEELLPGGGPIVLGSVSFQNFEVPESVTWGGAQAIVVHRYPGGRRDIDAMGPDDRDIEWSGTFLGPTAESRAHQVDALRVAGKAISLTFGTEFFTVVVRSFEPDFRRPSWLPYRIVCTVLRDGAQAHGPLDSVLPTSVQSDLSGAASAIQGTLTTVQNVVSAATPFLPAKTLSAINAVTGNASAALGLVQTAGTLAVSAGNFAFGAAASLAAETGTASAVSSIATGVSTAGSDIAAVAAAAPTGGLVGSVGDLIRAVSSGGVLAGLTQAQGAAGRAGMNISNGQP